MFPHFFTEHSFETVSLDEPGSGIILCNLHSETGKLIPCLLQEGDAMQKLCHPQHSAKGNTHWRSDKRENLRIAEGEENMGTEDTLTLFPL